MTVIVYIYVCCIDMSLIVCIYVDLYICMTNFIYFMYRMKKNKNYIYLHAGAAVSRQQSECEHVKSFER
jgi:hypothetical protein